MRYNKSNLAYDVVEHSEIDNLVSEVKSGTTKKKKKSVSKFLLFLSVIYILAISGSLLIKTAYVTEQNTELAKIKKEYSAILNENKKLEVSINSQIDLRKVEEVAISQLNMNRPLKSQIVYIDTAPKNYGEIVTHADEKQKNDNILTGLIKSFTGMFAYSN